MQQFAYEDVTKLNGFINHYPDFIAVTRSGKPSWSNPRATITTTAIPSASSPWEGSGSDWLGPRFKYFMVFQTRMIEGAWPTAEAMRLIAKL